MVLFARLDIHQVYDTILNVDSFMLFAALFLVFFLMVIKTVRWQVVLGAQAIHYKFIPALLAYFASMFVGFLTPGRLGEFLKALYVSQDCDVSSGRAFSGVLADRLFDLYAVFTLSMIAMMGLYVDTTQWVILMVIGVLLIVPLILFLWEKTYIWIQNIGFKSGRFGGRFIAYSDWFSEMRYGLRELSWTSVIVAIALTLIAYGLYFGQCYLLAMALKLPASFLQIAYAVALGGLVTLVPISISGVGTRDAVITAYLGTWGVSSEAALSFSLLVFVTFYVGGGLIGALAWWLKPLPDLTMVIPG
jgi:uncharacterized protein (TIRG00374 family)